MSMNAKQKQKLSHDLSRFTEFIHTQKAKLGSQMNRSIRSMDRHLKDLDLHEYRDSVKQFHAEMFGRLYEDIEELDTPSAKWAKDIHDTLDEIREFDELKYAVGDDADLSSLSAAYVMDKFKDIIFDTIQAVNEQAEQNKQENEENEKKNNQDGGNRPTNLPTDSSQIGLDDIDENKKKDIEFKAMKKTKGMQEFNDKVQEVKQAVDGCGIGNDPTSPERTELVKEIFNTSSISNLLQIIGRLRKEMRGQPSLVPSKRKVKVYEIEQDRAPKELNKERVLACNDDTYDTYCYRFANRKQWKRKKGNGKDKQGAGSIIMCLDVSGSMHGSSLELAKSVGLALLSIAKEKKRNFHICFFNTGLVGTSSYLKGDSESKFIETLKSISYLGASGGTCFDHPMTWAIDKAYSDKKADIVFLTDGCATLSNNPKIDTVKSKLGTRLFGLYVDTRTSPDLDQVLDGAIQVSDLKDEKSVSSIASLLNSVSKNK